MNPIEYFYKLGADKALLDFDINMPLEHFVQLYPEHLRPAVSSIFDSPDDNLVKDRATWFANNFLKSTGGLDRKLLRYALKEGLTGVTDTVGEAFEPTVKNRRP